MSEAGSIEKINLDNVDWESSREFFNSLKNDLRRIDEADNKEVYDLTWPGKRSAIVEAGLPINKTLRPDVAASKDFDNARNMLIVGDNLDALKLLQESYLNQVKMIYIDPPYNTGHDFVYHDNFRQSKADYDDGTTDDEGNRLVDDDEFKVNSYSNGRFHSDWLSMMYPRLKLARNLLTDDGVIFISIDDNEQANLKKLCDEVFGEENFVENFIWVKNSTKNLSKTTSTNHEYVLCYAKDIIAAGESEKLFRVPKKGLDAVKAILKKATEEGLTPEEGGARLREYYNAHPELKGISQYRYVDYGPKSDLISAPKCYQAYRLSDISAPKSTGVAETYEIIHPIDGLPCKTPSTGWRFARKTMQEKIDQGLIEFYDSHEHVPAFKRYLETVETEVQKSVIKNYKDGKKELAAIFGSAPFDNPKPVSLLETFIGLVDPDAIVLDFFAGSGTTGHAVMELNAQDGGNRRYILVQYPEKTADGSEAQKAGYETIDQITAERLRRAGDKVKVDHPDANFNTGFRVLRVDSDNEKEGIRQTPDKTTQATLFDAVDNIKRNRGPLDLLFGAIKALALPLDQKLDIVSGDSNTIYKYGYEFEGTGLVTCFDDAVSDETVQEIAKMRPNVAVFRDGSFTSSATKVNLSEHFRMLSPGTKVKVI